MRCYLLLFVISFASGLTNVWDVVRLDSINSLVKNMISMSLNSESILKSIEVQHFINCCLIVVCFHYCCHTNQRRMPLLSSTYCYSLFCTRAACFVRHLIAVGVVQLVGKSCYFIRNTVIKGFVLEEYSATTLMQSGEVKICQSPLPFGRSVTRSLSQFHQYYTVPFFP